MKPSDLLKGYQPMAFGLDGRTSPLLKWLMMTPGGQWRKDTAEVVFALLKNRGLLEYDRESGLWLKVADGTARAAAGKPDEGGLGTERVAKAVAGYGGKASFRDVLYGLMDGKGNLPGHWTLVRALARAEEDGYLTRARGRAAVYVLTPEGEREFALQVKAARAILDSAPPPLDEPAGPPPETADIP
jgi:hypothetical protein